MHTQTIELKPGQKWRRWSGEIVKIFGLQESIVIYQRSNQELGVLSIDKFLEILPDDPHGITHFYLFRLIEDVLPE